MTRALITGVTGFIGGHLASLLLREGWEVAALVRAESDTAALDPRIQIHRIAGEAGGLIEILHDVRPDIVFHLASLYLTDHTAEQVQDLVASNVLFPALLAEAMTATGCRRLVNTGTAWQHFGMSGYNPVNLYAATKQAALDLLRYHCDARELSLITLELFDTYGRGDPRRKLVQLLIDAALSGEPLGMSPGEQVIDLTHVEDVAEAFLVAGRRLLDTDAKLDERFLISGERLRVHELVTLVGDTLGRPMAVELGARPYRPREVMQPVMPDRHDRLPGWQPRRHLVTELPGLAGAD